MKVKRKLKKILSITASVCLVLTNMSFAFTDLTQDHWAKDAVQQMVEKNVLSGYDDGTFRPDSKITRAEFATILVKTLDIKEGATNVEFKDVEGTHWAEEYIDKANTFLTGYRYNNEYYFRPDDAALREDAAVAIVKAKGMAAEKVELSVLDDFKDKDAISENLKRYVAIAVKNGLMKGNSDGTFNPQGHLTRAEVAALFNNIYDYEKIVIDEAISEQLPNEDLTKDKIAPVVRNIGLVGIHYDSAIIYVNDISDEGGSGLNSIFYAYYIPGAEGFVEQNISNTESNFVFSVPVTVEGEYEIAVRAIDNAGNASVNSSEDEYLRLTFVYDKTSPVLPTVELVEKDEKTVTAKISGIKDEGGAGLHSIYYAYYVPGATDFVYNIMPNTQETVEIDIEKTTAGEYQFAAYIADKAANISFNPEDEFGYVRAKLIIEENKTEEPTDQPVVPPTEESIKDEIVPVVKSIKTDKYYYGKNDNTANVTVSGISDEGGSGLKTIFYGYHVPGAEKYEEYYMDNTESEYNISIPLTNEGEYEVAVRAIDTAGNASVNLAEDEHLRTTFVYDKTLPVIGNVELIEKEDKIIARITGIKDEGGAGLNSIYYGYYVPGATDFVYSSIENTKEEVEIEILKTTEGLYSFAAYAVDNASNQSFNPNDENGFVRDELTVGKNEEESKQVYTLKIVADNATVKYPEKALPGEKVKVEIVPDEGYIYEGGKQWNTSGGHMVGSDYDENGSMVYEYLLMPEEDVELELYMSKAYGVKIEANNATVKYLKKASPGSEVVIEIIPDEGYIYEGAKKWNIPVSPVQFKEDKKHNEIFETFIMPEQDVELELYLTKVVEEEPAKDDIAPVVKSIKTDKYYYGNNDDTADITVSGISDKGGAGLNSIFYAYYVPGTENFVDNNILNTESKCTFSIPLTKEGEYEVAVRAIDNAGNASVDSSEDEYLRTTFVYDKTLPVIGNVELIEREDKIIARITGIKDEGGSGLNSIWYGYYEPEEAEFVYDSTDEVKEEVEIELDKTIAGEYHFAVYVVDNASNQSFAQNDPDGFVRAQLTVAN